MPRGVCDPSPAPAHTLYLGVLNDQVSVEVQWTWDGVSTFPECDGDVQSVRIRNLTDVAVTAMLPNARKAAGRVYTAQPGLDMTISAPGTLRSLGFETYLDLLDLSVVEV